MPFIESMKTSVFAFLQTVFTANSRIAEAEALLVLFHPGLGPSSRDCLPCDFLPLLRCHGV